MIGKVNYKWLLKKLGDPPRDVKNYNYVAVRDLYYV